MKCFIKCELDPFNSNAKSGMINLGTAVNALVEDLIADRLQRVRINNIRGIFMEDHITVLNSRSNKYPDRSLICIMKVKIHFWNNFCKGDVFGHKREWQHYHGLNGTPDLLISAAKFLTKRITHNKRTVSEDNIRLVNGVTAALEVNMNDLSSEIIKLNNWMIQFHHPKKCI